MGCQDGKPLEEQPQPLLTPLFRIFAPPWAAPIKSEQIFFLGAAGASYGAARQQLVPDPALPSLSEELSKEFAKINYSPRLLIKPISSARAWKETSWRSSEWFQRSHPTGAASTGPARCRDRARDGGLAAGHAHKV